jgi:hypothetical protein
LRGTTSAAAGWMPTSAVNNSEKLTGPRIAVLKRPLFERLYDDSFIELSNTPLQQIAEYGKRCCPDTQQKKNGCFNEKSWRLLAARRSARRGEKITLII